LFKVLDRFVVKGWDKSILNTTRKTEDVLCDKISVAGRISQLSYCTVQDDPNISITIDAGHRSCLALQTS